ncbi:MAG TPA: imidazoleglycerol-phosphate dehydratase HisB [Rectinemataceae bacterium]|nr:imidazoleglycerol-phosphate dehydratase HisB [Rectinemataceae bacterium]
MEGLNNDRTASRTKQTYIVATRESKETKVKVELGLFPGPVSIGTGIGFLDHMLTSLACHAGWSLALDCEGDRVVDDHHSVEDCAITLGIALREAIVERGAIARFGYAYAPLDEALARAVVDVSGRPFCDCDLQLEREAIGELATENIGHFFASLAANAGLTLHVDVLKGSNDHHRAEAAFKALALALREALTPAVAMASASDAENAPASTKGTTVIKVTKREKAGEEKNE